MEQLRIAMFSDSSLPIVNGVSISVDCLITELRNRGHSVHLYAPRCPDHQDSDPNTYRFRAIRTIWAPNYPLAYPPFYRMLLRFRRHEYDLIHTHTPFATGMIGLRWAESHQLPIVSTYHTLYDRYAHYLRFFPRRYARFRIAKHTNFYYNSVDQVVTPSEVAKKWLLRHSVSTPVTVIPTGLRSRPFLNRSELREEFKIAPEHKVLLYVGRLAKEKNLPVLIEAVARVFAEDATARLILVGEGPYRESLTTMVRDAGIGDRVRFVGFMERDEVDRYYAAADVFVFSSITETQGLVVQEAMSNGLPVAAVAGGGASASIRQGVNGFVVKNDPESFSAAILKILRQPGLHLEMSEEAMKSVRDLSIPQMVNSVLDAYGRAIGSTRRPEMANFYAPVL